MRIPLQPTLTAKALDAEAVKDQGIGVTWMPSDGEDNMVGPQDHDNDAQTAMVNDDGPTPADYRIDVSEDGVKWMMGQDPHRLAAQVGPRRADGRQHVAGIIASSPSTT